ncbi:alpha/beta-hydrolase [Xylariaceae sp. FL0255]|nr:alpha/beta-hydrolase [Xylariaceae sp. FL0255]
MSPHMVDLPASTLRPAPKQWAMGTDLFTSRMPHHDGIQALWETKWKFPCTKSVYPFHDGQYADFEPIFSDLIARSVDDGYSPEYTQAFFGTAEALEKKGDAAMMKGEAGKQEASALYLRAAAVLRIARFPYISAFPEVTCSVKWRAWEMQKSIYMKAASQWDCPVEEVEIPFSRREGRDRESIPAYVRVPNTRGVSNKCPVVLLFTGLDGYRPDNTVRTEEFLSRGWAAVVVEIPGTADCPADPADPKSAERLWDSVFDWLETDPRFDLRRVMCWGLSSGGYYAVRLAHTHADKLAGVVAQGAGTHHFFDPVWLDRADGHEYPFQLLPALAMKHGYAGDVDGVRAYKQEAMGRFSLLENGILDRRCARLLLVNGTLDGLMPIEDSMLLCEYGSSKELRLFSGALHMGYPLANSSVYPWMESVMASVN